MRRAAGWILLILLALQPACFSEPEPEQHIGIPIYPQASVIRTIGQPGSELHELYLSSIDRAEQINAWYQDQFSRDGWEVSTGRGFGMKAVISATKKNRSVGIQIFEQSDRRIIHQTTKIKRRRIF